MQRKTQRVMKFTLICAACLFLLTLRLRTAAQHSCEATGCCFITPAGAGAKTGVDWNNAYADLPTRLTRGVMYFLAGSATSYRDHKFDDPDSGDTQIYIYKAVDCRTVPSAAYCGTVNPASVVGWQASFGSNTANWIEASPADPETNVNSVWQFCSSYYLIDGITGSASPPNPGDQGIVLGLDGESITGIVDLSPDGCASPPSGLQNITFSHMEVKGSGHMPYFPVSVTACSYNGANATVTIGASLHGVANDFVSGWTRGNAVLFQTVAASSISSTQVVVPLPSNPCSSLASVGLDFLPSEGFFGIDLHVYANTLTDITLQYSYVHDVSNAFDLRNPYNVNLFRNFLARNRSTPTQHDSMTQWSEGSISTTAGPVSIAYNFFLDSNGTSDIYGAGGATTGACSSNCGTLQNVSVYGNIFTCDFLQLTLCGSGLSTVSDNSGLNNLVNLHFTNNTIAFESPGGPELLSPGSTGTIIEDNLFYDLSGTSAVRGATAAALPAGSTTDYNTVLNCDVALGTQPISANGTWLPAGAGNPFLNSAVLDFHLIADMNVATNSRTASAQGISLSFPYDIDLDGKTRGADGTWERGAYEFVGTQKPLSHPARVHPFP